MSRTTYRVTIDRIALIGAGADRLGPETLAKAVAAAVSERLTVLAPGASGVREAAREVGAAVAGAVGRPAESSGARHG